MAYKAIVAGASGLIGSNLVNILLQSPEYDEVVVLVRKELPLQHPKLVQATVDFDQPLQYEHLLNGHALFSCLGTTKAQTPDKKEYRKIDFEYPLRLAQLAYRNGVKQFHLVSSIGADKNSMAFYTKLKGELEDALQKTGLPTLHIYQPSMLVGNRRQKRALERAFIFLFKMIIDPLLIGNLKKYRSINASTVANAMYKKSLAIDTGTYIHPSDKIQTI